MVSMDYATLATLGTLGGAFLGIVGTAVGQYLAGRTNTRLYRERRHDELQDELRSAVNLLNAAAVEAQRVGDNDSTEAERRAASMACWAAHMRLQMLADESLVEVARQYCIALDQCMWGRQPDVPAHERVGHEMHGFVEASSTLVNPSRP